MAAPSEKTPIGALILLGLGCAGTGGDVDLRLEGDGCLRLKSGRVSVLRLKAEDKAEILERLEGNPEAGRKKLGLPEDFDPRPLLIEAAGGDRAEALFQLLRFLAGVGPPYCVNLALSTPEGVVPIPVLFRFRQGLPPRGQAPPYEWAFFRDGRVLHFDEDPDPPPGFSGQSVEVLRLAPAGGDDFLIHASPGGFDLVPFEGLPEDPRYPHDKPAAILGLSLWGAGLGTPLDASGHKLTGTGDDAKKRRDGLRLTDARMRTHPHALSRGWRAVRGWEQVEEVVAGVAAWKGVVNPVLRYTLLRGGVEPTVADYVRVLELAHRHGFKGVVTYVP